MYFLFLYYCESVFLEVTGMYGPAHNVKTWRERNIMWQNGTILTVKKRTTEVPRTCFSCGPVSHNAYYTRQIATMFQSHSYEADSPWNMAIVKVQ